MPDPAQHTHGPDARINIHEDWELRYWTRELGIGRNELRKIIDEVGDRAEQVRAYLSSNRAAEHAST